ncbi:MAG: hypothetical protein DI564_11695 [Rhodanobacter denitrificans]|uniref:Uncharacterized protein n=1 Tax=Rhodanobacter denitrificans TaxID=666685 RepID=A0A2W5K7K2_9GAMM|nr:MAG: hypothetical protein DI564_11695 [Rhodanobacter denitrificans]
MRTLVLILIGLVVLALMTALSRPARRPQVALVFVGLWLVACAINLAVGLSHGYTLGEELGIHLVLFGVPAAAAWFVRGRAMRALSRVDTPKPRLDE